MGTRHPLQARRSAEHRLHSYVDHNSSSGFEPVRGTPRSTGTLPSPQPALMLTFQWSTAASHRDIFGTPWASGDAHVQTHTRRFTPAKLPHCSIAAGLCVEQRHSPGRRLLYIDSVILKLCTDTDSSTCVCVVCVFFPFILDINGRTSRGHTGGRSHRIFHPPSFCGACLNFSREKDSATPFPRRT